MTWTTVKIAPFGVACGPPLMGAEGDGTRTVSWGASAPPTGLLVYWSGSPACAKSTPEITGTRRGCGTSAGPTRLQRATRATRTMPNRLGVICLCSSDSRGNHPAMGGARGIQRQKLRKQPGTGVPPPQGLSDQSTVQEDAAFGPALLNRASIIGRRGGGKSGPVLPATFLIGGSTLDLQGPSFFKRDRRG
jgi:hypothetical protein